MSEQLVLDLGPEHAQLRVLTKQEAGLTKEMPPGPERLLSEMVKRGLERDHLVAAAALVFAFDERRGSR